MAREYQITTRAACLVAAVLLLGGEPAIGASDLAASLDELVARHAPRAIELRHAIHRNPELSNREEETAALVAEHLRGLGLEVETGIAHTGVLGVLRGERPGPTVAVRFDMDALPVTERSGLPFASTKRATYLGQEVGVAHACGHDIHTSVGLGVASVLSDLREQLPGTVLFVFQPAEEGAPQGEEGGAELMLEEDVFAGHDPQAIFALHSWPQLTVGEVGVTSGPAYAAVDHFYVDLHGRQAHGAHPDASVDPIVIGAEAVQALQTIRSRNLDPRAASVVTIGIFRGGERYNIIPESVHLEGTVRTYDTQIQDQIERRMREILDGITAAHGASYDLTYDRVTPATVNDAELHGLAVAALGRALGADRVVTGEPTMGGEDFAYFANRIPGYYFRLGTTAPGTESGGLHTPTFRADDGAIPVGMEAMSALVLDFLYAARSSSGSQASSE